MKRLLLLLSCFLCFAPADLQSASDIVVKQDKNGKIVISNISRTPVRQRRTAGVSNASASTAVPSGYYQKIQRLSKKHRLREDLIIAVARAESSFNPEAISRKGAVGIMQLMKDTARQYGVADRFDVDQNLEAGIQHLKYLYEKYNKNIPLTLAAYNAGEEAVKKYRGTPPYRETQAFIKRVMRYMGLGYSRLFPGRANTKIYRYISADGRTVITDSPPSPSKSRGKIEIIK